MKKGLVCLLTMGIITVMSVNTFAAFDPNTGTNETITGNDAGSTNEKSISMPVYGYIGEDAEITDPEPENPVTPPTVTPGGTSINVSVPVKFMWAAFASDGGQVTSPNYQIVNNSTAIELDVTMVNFAARTTADNTAVDSKLILNLTGTEMSLGNATTSIVGMSNHAYGVTLGRTAADNTWNFAISGNYSGSFSATKTPTYDMTLRFALH